LAPLSNALAISVTSKSEINAANAVFIAHSHFPSDAPAIGSGVRVLRQLPDRVTFLMRTETEVREKAAKLGLTLPA
jgi:hypothetical protein